MRTPNPPTGFSLSQICRPRPLTAPAGLYNQKLTHLRLLIDLPLLFEARPQPSITYRSLRDSYKADRDTNAQNSAGTNQFSTIGHSSYGNCLLDADRRPPRGWAMRWGLVDRCRVLSLRVGRSGLGRTNACQIPESLSEFLDMETTDERAQLASFRREWNPSAFPRSSRAVGPDKRGACRRARSRRTKAFSSGTNLQARKPRNEMALNPLKTNDPAKS